MEVQCLQTLHYYYILLFNLLQENEWYGSWAIHSFFWAQQRAAAWIYGASLGLDPAKFKFFWRGCWGMVWEELIFKINRMHMLYPPPDVILIDIGQIRTLDLVANIQNTIWVINISSPQLVFVFSEIIPRLRWLESSVFKPFDKVRKRVNRAI